MRKRGAFSAPRKTITGSPGEEGHENTDEEHSCDSSALAGACFGFRVRPILFDLARNGTPQAVQSARAKGAELKAYDQDSDGRTAFMIAASFNSDPEVISVFLNAGVAVEARSTPSGKHRL